MLWRSLDSDPMNKSPLLKSIGVRVDSYRNQVDLDMHPYCRGSVIRAHHTRSQQIWTTSEPIWLRNKPSLTSQEMLCVVRSNISGDAWQNNVLWGISSLSVYDCKTLMFMHISALSFAIISNQTITGQISFSCLQNLERFLLNVFPVLTSGCHLK